MDRAAGMDTAGNERRGRGNGAPATTWWWAFLAMVVAVAVKLDTLLNLVKRLKDDEDALWRLFNKSKILAGKFSNGGCCVGFDPTKWAFIVPLVLTGMTVGIYI